MTQLVAHYCTILASCLAVLTASTLGLNRGMVVCLDHHGHLAVEAAHVRHAHCHGDGADHAHDDFGADADHAALHAALGDCSDTGAGESGYRDKSESSRRAAPSPAPVHFLSVTPFRPPPGAAVTASTERGGVAAHTDLASLRVIVLLV